MRTTDGDVVFFESLADHGVRVALALLDHLRALETDAVNRVAVHTAWLVLESSRPWPDRAWERALSAATVRVESRAEVTYATSFLLVALARESRGIPERDAQLEALAQEAEATGAPWAKEFDRVLGFRRALRAPKKRLVLVDV